MDDIEKAANQYAGSNLKPNITKENARLFAAKSAEVRRRNKEARERLAAEEARVLKEQAIAAAEAAHKAAKSDAPESFTSRTRTRVRLAIDRLLDKLDAEDNPQALDRLAAAAAKLGDFERNLDNRPLPGSLRPTAKRSQQATLEPV